MRALLLALVGALAFATAVGAQSWHPSASWMAQARCVHAKEGPWTANTGNGQFGGMQFSGQTWLRLNGAAVPALKHPGDPAFPFAVSAQEQLHRAWLLWKQDGGTWRSWGAVGASCTGRN